MKLVVDTSAVVAFLRSEPEADGIEAALADAREIYISAFTVFEARVVLARRFGPHASADFELLLVKLRAEITPFDSEQADLAAGAYRRFGKGSGHPAQLNLGDCASYALARQLDLPLLFKGDDFGRTDLKAALSTGPS